LKQGLGGENSLWKKGGKSGVEDFPRDSERRAFLKMRRAIKS
jgi:hypothetical protein